MFLILSMIFFIIGCDEEDTKKQGNSIYGTWQLVESFSHPPSGNGWSQVDNGFTLTVKSDNSFYSSQFSNCMTGDISLTDDQIDLKYNCNGFTQGFENPAGVFQYTYEFVENKLQLTPKNFSCFEGCKYELIKIPSEE